MKPERCSVLGPDWRSPGRASPTGAQRPTFVFFALRCSFTRDGIAPGLHTPHGLQPPRREEPKASDLAISVYFDTAGRDLQKAGVSLRVRESRGRRVQTLKRGEGLSREEYEARSRARRRIPRLAR